MSMKSETSHHKPGPKPKGFKRVNAFLPPDMIEWGKDHPEGLSGLIRRLMATERHKLEAERARARRTP